MRGEGHLMVLEFRGWGRVRVATMMVVVGMSEESTKING